MALLEVLLSSQTAKHCNKVNVIVIVNVNVNVTIFVIFLILYFCWSWLIIILINCWKGHKFPNNVALKSKVTAVHCVSEWMPRSLITFKQRKMSLKMLHILIKDIFGLNVQRRNIKFQSVLMFWQNYKSLCEKLKFVGKKLNLSAGLE